MSKCLFILLFILTFQQCYASNEYDFSTIDTLFKASNSNRGSEIKLILPSSMSSSMRDAADEYNECYYRNGGLPDDVGGWFTCGLSTLPAGLDASGTVLRKAKLSAFVKASSSESLVKVVKAGGDKGVDFLVRKVPESEYSLFVGVLDSGDDVFRVRYMDVLSKSGVTKRSLRENPEVLELLGDLVKRYGSDEDVLRTVSSLLSRDGGRNAGALRVVLSTSDDWSAVQISKLGGFDGDVYDVYLKYSKYSDCFKSFEGGFSSSDVSKCDIIRIEYALSELNNIRKIHSYINPKSAQYETFLKNLDNLQLKSDGFRDKLYKVKTLKNLASGKNFEINPDLSRMFEFGENGKYLAIKNVKFNPNGQMGDNGILVLEKSSGRIAHLNAEKGHLYESVYSNLLKNIPYKDKSLVRNLERESEMFFTQLNSGREMVFFHNMEAQFADMGRLDDNGWVIDIANTGPDDAPAKLGNKIGEMLDSGFRFKSEITFYLDHVDFNLEETKWILKKGNIDYIDPTGKTKNKLIDRIVTNSITENSIQVYDDNFNKITIKFESFKGELNG